MYKATLYKEIQRQFSYTKNYIYLSAETLEKLQDKIITAKENGYYLESVYNDTTKEIIF